MMKNKPNWVMVPGNHDFNYLGSYEKGSVSNIWKSACQEKENTDGRYNKAEFIFAYLEALSAQSELANADPSYVSFAECLKHDV